MSDRPALKSPMRLPGLLPENSYHENTGYWNPDQSTFLQQLFQVPQRRQQADLAQRANAAQVGAAEAGAQNALAQARYADGLHFANMQKAQSDALVSGHRSKYSERLFRANADTADNNVVISRNNALKSGYEADTARIQNQYAPQNQANTARALEAGADQAESTAEVAMVESEFARDKAEQGAVSDRLSNQRAQVDLMAADEERKALERDNRQNKLIEKGTPEAAGLLGKLQELYQDPNFGTGDSVYGKFVDMYKTLLSNPDTGDWHLNNMVPVLRAMAADALPIMQHHLDRMPEDGGSRDMLRLGIVGGPGEDIRRMTYNNKRENLVNNIEELKAMTTTLGAAQQAAKDYKFTEDGVTFTGQGDIIQYWSEKEVTVTNPVTGTTEKRMVPARLDINGNQVMGEREPSKTQQVALYIDQLDERATSVTLDDAQDLLDEYPETPEGSNLSEGAVAYDYLMAREELEADHMPGDLDMYQTVDNALMSHFGTAYHEAQDFTQLIQKVITENDIRTFDGRRYLDTAEIAVLSPLARYSTQMVQKHGDPNGDLWQRWGSDIDKYVTGSDTLDQKIYSRGLTAGMVATMREDAENIARNKVKEWIKGYETNSGVPLSEPTRLWLESQAVDKARSYFKANLSMASTEVLDHVIDKIMHTDPADAFIESSGPTGEGSVAGAAYHLYRNLQYIYGIDEDSMVKLSNKFRRYGDEDNATWFKSRTRRFESKVVGERFQSRRQSGTGGLVDPIEMQKIENNYITEQRTIGGRTIAWPLQENKISFQVDVGEHSGEVVDLKYTTLPNHKDGSTWALVYMPGHPTLGNGILVNAEAAKMMSDAQVEVDNGVVPDMSFIRRALPPRVVAHWLGGQQVRPSMPR